MKPPAGSAAASETAASGSPPAADPPPPRLAGESPRPLLAAETLRPLLAIESTCDETAAAIIHPDGRVLGQSIATQDRLHERFAGVVPEIAARGHVEAILPVVDRALRTAGVDGPTLSAIAVADRPGLAGSLLVGMTAAKSLALAWDLPLIAINHLHAHLYACRMSADVVATNAAENVTVDATAGTVDAAAGDADVYPALGLVVSGGHSSMYRCDGPLELRYLGGTIDDAVGEAFDKVGAMLGLPFPGGPAVSRLAARGDRAAFAFPRSMTRKSDGDDFSFSGLKTAVRYAITGGGNVDPKTVQVEPDRAADICASFEAAVVETVMTKALRAAKREGLRVILVGGGVAANAYLRDRLRAAAGRDAIRVIVADPALCTDNAAMGAIAWEHYRRGDFASSDADITPGLQRGF